MNIDNADNLTNQVGTTSTIDSYRGRYFSMLLACVMAASVGGCGPSKDDLIQRAMQRKRPVAEDVLDDRTSDGVAQPVSQQKTVPVVAKAANSQTKTDAAPVDGGSDSQADSVASDDQPPMNVAELDIAELDILPIDERAPTEVLDDAGRRRLAVQNLKSVHQALMRYVKDHDRFPYYTMESSGGIATMSWRVELLPYLGYQSLYDKFQVQRPWDSPQNLELLKFIPPVFVSPERQDTRTNIVAPIGNGYVFHDINQRDEDSSEPKITTPKHVVDGLGNTIVLLEVDDEFAVPWTKPADYQPFVRDAGSQPYKRGIGKLRGGGAFAIWGNGWPLSLDPNLPAKQFAAALTYAGNERQAAAVIHREVDLGSLPTTVLPTTVLVTQTMSPPVAAEIREPIDAPGNQVDVPDAITIGESEDQFQKLFGRRIRDASDRRAKATLAQQILQTSTTMSADPAGAYVMQRAAIDLGNTSGAIDVVIEAIGLRTAMFTVDPYEQNASALLDFARISSRLDPASINGAAYLQQAIRVIHLAIERDQYEQARLLARSSARLLGDSRANQLSSLLTRLGISLGESGRHYDNAKSPLAAFRQDPDDDEAASVVGRYLCFVKGDWDRGIPLLARGGPESLRRIARKESRGADDHGDAIEIADDWWDLADQARVGVYQQGALDRAQYWYESVFAEMPDSLDRIHVKARLHDLSHANASSPLAVIRLLASESGVDLELPLSQTPGQGARLTRAIETEGVND